MKLFFTFASNNLSRKKQFCTLSCNKDLSLCCQLPKIINQFDKPCSLQLELHGGVVMFFLFCELPLIYISIVLNIKPTKRRNITSATPFTMLVTLGNQIRFILSNISGEFIGNKLWEGIN